MVRHLVLVPLFLFLTTASSVAQSRFELTPFWGLRAGGSFRATDVEAVLNIKRSAGYGLTFGVDLNENMGVEFLWSRQRSSLEAVPLIPSIPGQPPLTIDLPEIDVIADYYHGAFVYGGGPPGFQPYVTVGAGVSRFDSQVEGVSPVRKFSFSIGTGFKSFFSERIGVRFDARAFGTRIGDQREDFTCSVFGCATFETAATFWQGQVVGGVIVGF